MLRPGDDLNQPRSDPVAGAPRSRRDVVVAAAHRRDVVGHRLAREPVLDRDELPLQVLVEGDEDQALVELAGLVEAALVVPGAAQQALVVAVRRCAGWRAGCASPAGPARPSGRGPAAGRRTRRGRPAARPCRGGGRSSPSCSRSPTRSQNSRCIRISRTAMYVPPAGRPHKLAHQRVVGRCRGSPVPSRKPNRLRRALRFVGPAVGALEAVDPPAQRERVAGRAQQLAQRVRGGVHVVRADRDDDVAVR